MDPLKITPSKKRNDIARAAWERNGGGPHTPKTTYNRNKCETCGGRLDKNDLCSECDLKEDWE